MKTILKKLYRLSLRFIPENRTGNKLVSFLNFLRVHRRFPTHKLLFNDVLYRIKTTDEIIDPLRVFVSDKEFVKLYVKAVAGDQFNVPTLKILHTIEEVQDYQFPSDCCIKPTHLSGKVILRRQKSPIDFEEIDNWFKRTYSDTTREANYKSLKHKVIVEPLVFDNDNLCDYKIFCHNGNPKLIQVDFDRYINHSRKFYGPDWNEMPFSLLYPLSSHQLEKPKNLDKMLTLATTLSSHFNFVRIDLYSNGEECLVGEITNCPENATGFFIPKSGEILASNMIFGSN
jgi:hypothetical protein